MSTIATAWRVAVVAAGSLAGAAHAQPWEPNQAVARTIVLDRERTGQWLTILPESYADDGVFPVLMVFGGGPGTFGPLSAAMSQFDPECRKRGWIVVGLQTPEGEKPTEPRTSDVLRVMQEVRARVRVEGDKFHLAGPSNGGIASLSFAVERPDLVASVTAFPGYLLPKFKNQLERLTPVPIRLFVGSDDLVEWTDASRELAERGKAAGLNIALDVRIAQPHGIGDLKAAALLDMLEPFRPRLGTPTTEQAAIGRVLDDLHIAAHLAQEDRYFHHFAPEGVFIGTDAAERWDVPAFRAYAHPLFSKGKGWSYWLRERHVQVLPGGQTAWFDELLDNDKYGVSRGSGVLRREGEPPRWMISQYHLTFPVPNELAERVTRMIKTEGEKRRK